MAGVAVVAIDAGGLAALKARSGGREAGVLVLVLLLQLLLGIQVDQYESMVRDQALTLSEHVLNQSVLLLQLDVVPLQQVVCLCAWGQGSSRETMMRGDRKRCQYTRMPP